MNGGAFTFDFVGLHGRPARCGLEIVPLPDGRTMVICTELADNPGVSVTNFAEELATLVCKRWQIAPHKLLWIEHYNADPCPICAGEGSKDGVPCRACDARGTRRRDATFDLVTFSTAHRGNDFVLTSPEWRSIRKEELLRLPLKPQL